MKVSINSVAKKLVLWHTPTFRPLLSHAQLEPFLFSVGFISFPAYDPPPPSTLSPEAPSTTPAVVQWKEYAFPLPSSHAFPALSSSSSHAIVDCGIPLPRPRLPFPMIYGLHLVAYKAFLSALECYIGPSAVYNLFHVRALPVIPFHDERFEDVYTPMKDYNINGGEIFFYRGGAVFDCMTEQIEAMKLKEEIEKMSGDRRIKGSRCRCADEIVMVSLDSLLPGRWDMLSSRF
ncbi:hypothetical protein KSP39_PZI010773 [Platanthera zijinensis]|uniref:Uncharacterized protein n=1 Tax=Platanthera zijinensis TaxID=2320716 RepID=A0AAP0G797_9ASPA